jgi:hypothetical protein
MPNPSFLRYYEHCIPRDGNKKLGLENNFPSSLPLAPIPISQRKPEIDGSTGCVFDGKMYFDVLWRDFFFSFQDVFLRISFD